MRGRRCASLRSSSNPPRPVDVAEQSTPIPPPRVSPTSAETPVPKKSNWEVIEHFQENRTPTAVSIKIFDFLLERIFLIKSLFGEKFR